MDRSTDVLALALHIVVDGLNILEGTFELLSFNFNFF
jgi:hypothetical protein